MVLPLIHDGHHDAAVNTEVHMSVRVPGAGLWGHMVKQRGFVQSVTASVVGHQEIPVGGSSRIQCFVRKLLPQNHLLQAELSKPVRISFLVGLLSSSVSTLPDARTLLVHLLQVSRYQWPQYWDLT